MSSRYVRRAAGTASTGAGRLATVVLLLGVMLSACSRDKGDPVRISKDFLVSLWTQDIERVQALTCSDWRDVTAQWAAETGNPDTTVDTGHLIFAVVSENDRQVTLEMGGVATMKSPDGQVEVRDYDTLGYMRIILVDESGWKVCDVRDTPQR